MLVLEPGTRVEVRSQFDQAWAAGFEVAEELMDDGEYAYRVRRLSDGMVLPRLFGRDAVRRERNRRSTWWI